MWQQDYVYPQRMAAKSYGDLADYAAKDAAVRLGAGGDLASQLLKDAEKVNDRAWQAQKLYSELEPDVMFANRKLETYENPKAIADYDISRRELVEDEAKRKAETSLGYARLKQSEKESQRDYALRREGNKLNGRALSAAERKMAEDVGRFTSPVYVNSKLDEWRARNPNLPAGVLREVFGIQPQVVDDGRGGKRTVNPTALHPNQRISPEQAKLLWQRLSEVDARPLQPWK